MKTTPNYYSILPANVRYCKELTFFEIVLYSELTALANKNGFCYASNNYFAKLYGKAPETISRAISKLENLSFIRVEIEKESENQRKIYITPIDKNINTPIDKNINTPIDKNVNTPIDKNVKYNNTSNNNTRYNTSYYKQKKIKPVPDWYPEYQKQIKNTQQESKTLDQADILPIVRDMLD